MTDLAPYLSGISAIAGTVAAFYAIRANRRLARQGRSVTWELVQVATNTFALRNAGPGTAHDVHVDLSRAMALSQVPQAGVVVASGTTIPLGSLAPTSKFTAWPTVEVRYRCEDWRGRPGDVKTFETAMV